MKFAHIADCHIGSWRDPKLRDAATEAFKKAIGICIRRDVDFVLISGDLFNTSIPEIDRIATVTGQLKELNDKDIRVYIVPGSHDFSPSGKTMLNVLENAGLVKNVVRGEVTEGKLRLKFTEDKAGAKITGMLGRRGMLEKSYYEDLDRSALEKEEGYKIFMFHTALTEFKSEELENMESAPLSLLPKGFDYYAAGHVHERIEKEEPGYGKIVYPGPLFPNSFRELEKLSHGGFYIIEDGKPVFVPVVVHKTHRIELDCDMRSPEQVHEALLPKEDHKDEIVTIRLKGKLGSGRVFDIDFKSIFAEYQKRGAFFVMKNTASLASLDYEEVKVEAKSKDDIEGSLIREQAGQLEGRAKEDDTRLTRDLLQLLDDDKAEGEKSYDFEARIRKGMDKVLTGF